MTLPIDHEDYEVVHNSCGFVGFRMNFNIRE